MASNRGELTGKTLGTCVLEDLVGQGGMGAVYLARQTRPTRRVAVKVLLPNTAMSSEVYEAFLARFRREADVVAKLEHVNIMPIYEYGEEDNLAYLVMPYLTGGSLKEVLQRQGALPLQQVATYLDQAASALDYAHAQGVIHRDLKPANFLLAADGRLVLADFGIARIMEDTTGNAGLTSTGMIVGTPEYMAPEMVNGEPVDYRADIYELGIVLFQMVSGHVPFRGTTPIVVITKQIQQTLPLLHQLNPAIPAAVDAVIQKATAKKREERYSSVSAFAQDFRRAISQAPAPYIPYVVDMQDNATLAVEPTIAQATQRQYNTSSPQQEPLYYNQGVPQGANTYGDYQRPASSPYNTTGTTPYQTPASNNNRPLLIILGILVALVLIVAGVSGGLLLNNRNQPGHTGTTPTPGATTVPTATPKATATATKAVTPTPSPTKQPTVAPTATPQPTAAPTQPATVPVGNQLYVAASPGNGTGCDSGGGTWENYNNVQVACQNGKSVITNSTQNFGGTFLTAIPGQTYPNNYVIQVQLQQDTASNANFGIYFRNQPGSQQGAYTLLIEPNGTWVASVYDNTTGQPTRLRRGNFGDSHALVTLAVVVNGNNFTFYANGNKLGGAYSAQYPSGTAGIAVAQGGTVTASNFEMYTPAS